MSYEEYQRTNATDALKLEVSSVALDVPKGSERQMLYVDVTLRARVFRTTAQARQFDPMRPPTEPLKFETDTGVLLASPPLQDDDCLVIRLRHCEVFGDKEIGVVKCYLKELPLLYDDPLCVRAGPFVFTVKPLNFGMLPPDGHVPGSRPIFDYNFKKGSGGSGKAVKKGGGGSKKKKGTKASTMTGHAGGGDLSPQLTIDELLDGPTPGSAVPSAASRPVEPTTSASPPTKEVAGEATKQFSSSNSSTAPSAAGPAAPGSLPPAGGLSQTSDHRPFTLYRPGEEPTASGSGGDHLSGATTMEQPPQSTPKLTDPHPTVIGASMQTTTTTVMEGSGGATKSFPQQQQQQQQQQPYTYDPAQNQTLRSEGSVSSAGGGVVPPPPPAAAVSSQSQPPQEPYTYTPDFPSSTDPQAKDVEVHGTALYDVEEYDIEFDGEGEGEGGGGSGVKSRSLENSFAYDAEARSFVPHGGEGAEEPLTIHQGTSMESQLTWTGTIPPLPPAGAFSNVRMRGQLGNRVTEPSSPPSSGVGRLFRGVVNSVKQGVSKMENTVESALFRDKFPAWSATPGLELIETFRPQMANGQGTPIGGTLFVTSQGMCFSGPLMQYTARWQDIKFYRRATSFANDSIQIFIQNTMTGNTVWQLQSFDGVVAMVGMMVGVRNQSKFLEAFHLIGSTWQAHLTAGSASAIPGSTVPNAQQYYQPHPIPHSSPPPPQSVQQPAPAPYQPPQPAPASYPTGYPAGYPAPPPSAPAPATSQQPQI